MATPEETAAAEAAEAETAEAVVAGTDAGEKGDDAEEHVITQSDDDKGDGKAADDSAGETPVVPETYELKAHKERELDAALIEQATPIFKELKLSQEAAQKLVDFQIDIAVQQEETFREGLKANAAAIKQEHGANYKAHANGIHQLMKAFAPEGLAESFEATGMSSDPAMFNFLHAIRAGFSEDTLVGLGAGGKKPAAVDRTDPEATARAFYDGAQKATG